MLTPDRPLVEVAIDSLEAARIAVAAGADRLELCQSLDCGGLTPSPGMVEALEQSMRVPIFVMVRPRAGAFGYTDEEKAIMVRDAILAKGAGADGIVTGGLDREGRVDRDLMERIVAAVDPLPVTFHRAIDLVVDGDVAIATLIASGVRRVLTSGGAPTAFEGRAVIRKWVLEAGPRLTVLAGGGVRGEQLRELVATTGIREVHLAGVRPGVTSPSAFGVAMVPDAERLTTFFAAADRLRRIG